MFKQFQIALLNVNNLKSEQTSGFYNQQRVSLVELFLLTVLQLLGEGLCLCPPHSR